MNTAAKQNLYDRLTGWLLPGIVMLTPLIVLFPMKPPEQQSYFLILAALALSASLGAAWIVGARPLPGRPTMPIILGLGLGAAAAISMVLSGQVLFGMKKAMLPLCAFVVLGHILNHPRRRVVLQRSTVLLAGIGVMLAIYGIAQFMGFEILSYGEVKQKNTVIATIGHPNFLGSLLGPVLFILLGLTLTWRTRLARVPVVAGIFLVLLCIALARTRAVWLGMFCGFVLLVALTLRYSLRHHQGMRLVGMLIGGLAAGIGGVVLIVLAVLPAMNRGIDITERLLSNYEIKSRLYYWSAAIDLGNQRPAFGNGVGMFDPNFWPYASQQRQSEMGPYYYDVLPAIAGKTPEHPHNEYLEIFCEQGYVGIALLAAFLTFFLYFGYVAAMRSADGRQALPMICFYCAFVMMLIDAAFGFPWRLPASLLALTVILGWLYELIYPQPLAEPEPPRWA